MTGDKNDGVLYSRLYPDPLDFLGGKLTMLELTEFGKVSRYLMEHADKMTREEYNRYYDAVMKVNTGIMDMVLLRRELQKKEKAKC